MFVSLDYKISRQGGKQRLVSRGSSPIGDITSIAAQKDNSTMYLMMLETDVVKEA